MPYGTKSRLGLSFQNSYGTSLQDSVFWLPKVNEDINLQIPALIEQNMRGILDEGAHHEGPKMVSGSINMEAAPIPLGVLLKAVLGEPTTVQSDALYTHTFEPATDDFDKFSAGLPITIEKYLDVGSSNLFSDMNGSKIMLKWAQGAFMEATAEFVGGTFAQQEASAVSYPPIPLWTWDVTSVAIGAVAKAEVMDLTVELDNVLEAQHTLSGSKFPSRIKRTGFRILNISGTLKFDDALEYQAFLDQSERELIVHAEGTVEVQSGYNNSLTAKLPLFRHTEFPPNAGGPGEIEVGFSSKGVYSITSATAAQFILANGQSAY